MLAFKPIEVASVCLPSEAALWLALGRLPEMYLTDDFVEARNSIGGLVEDYHMVPELHPFGQNEIEANGVDGDYEKYFQAFIDRPAQTFDEFFNGLEGSRWNPVQGPPRPEGHAQIALVQGIEDCMNAIIERARLRVRLALIEGSLSAYGFVVPPNWVQEDGGWYRDDGEPDGTRQLEQQVKVAQIPGQMWASFPSTWEIGDGIAYPDGFIGTWIPLSQVLELFPTPLLPVQEVQCQRVGETLLLGGNTREIEKNTPRRRGRPKKGGIEVEAVIVNEFKRRAAKGDLPVKREAVVQDSIDWASQILGVSVSRSAAQRYLRPVFDAQK